MMHVSKFCYNMVITVTALIFLSQVKKQDVFNLKFMSNLYKYVNLWGNGKISYFN